MTTRKVNMRTCRKCGRVGSRQYSFNHLLDGWTCDDYSACDRRAVARRKNVISPGSTERAVQATIAPSVPATETLERDLPIKAVVLTSRAMLTAGFNTVTEAESWVDGMADAQEATITGPGADAQLAQDAAEAAFPVGTRVEYRFWESNEFHTGTVESFPYAGVCRIKRDGYREYATMPLDKMADANLVRPVAATVAVPTASAWIPSDNDGRAERAEMALEDYYPDDEHAGAITDMLTDLRHLCARANVDFQRCLDMSETHYAAED